MATTLRAALAEVLPTADSIDNASMSDVIGNKTDTSAGNSIIALQKETLELIGEVADVPFEDSIFGNLNALYRHIHSPANVYPTLADGKTVTGAAGAWTLGTVVELIPAGAIAVAFDIHYLNIEVASATDVYEIVLYNESGEIGRVRTTKQTNQSGANNVPIQIPPQAAGEQIRIAVASKTGGGDSLTLSVFYHTYA